jgi:hypothetical protein
VDPRLPHRCTVVAPVCVLDDIQRSDVQLGVAKGSSEFSVHGTGRRRPVRRDAGGRALGCLDRCERHLHRVAAVQRHRVCKGEAGAAGGDNGLKSGLASFLFRSTIR